MNHAPDKKGKQILRFDHAWSVGVAVSGALGYASVCLIIFFFSSDPSRLLEQLFVPHFLISLTACAVCASLFQGWLLSRQGLSFRRWVISSVLGHTLGLLLVYLTEQAASRLIIFSPILVVFCASIFQAYQLRGYVEVPYLWSISLTGTMVLVNFPYLFFATVSLLPDSTDVGIILTVSVIVGVAFALMTAFSLHTTRPNFEIYFHFALGVPEEPE